MVMITTILTSSVTITMAVVPTSITKNQPLVNPKDALVTSRKIGRLLTPPALRPSSPCSVPQPGEAASMRQRENRACHVRIIKVSTLNSSMPLHERAKIADSGAKSLVLYWFSCLFVCVCVCSFVCVFCFRRWWCLGFRV